MPQPNQSQIPLAAEEFPFADKYPTPLHVLYLHNEDVREGRVKIHDWQRDILLELGRKRVDFETIKAMLVAANGSGKSQYVLAPFAVWLALTKKQSLTVITTASGEQLDTQACRYITSICNNINQMYQGVFGYNVFLCNYREIRGNITKSFIDLFATDEPGKAEGRHPISATGEFVVIVDEAKTVDDDIFVALNKCNGQTRRLEISSPGDCSGYFYKNWTNPKYSCYRRKVTAYDCPHLRAKEIEDAILIFGLNHPHIRSSIFAEFVSLQNVTIIPRDLLQRCVRMRPTQYFFGPLVGGLDLSAGGDETVLSVWNGNVEIGLHTFKEADTYIGAEKIIEITKSYKGRLEASNIWADDGGLGKSMIDILNHKGYKVKRMLNQARPHDATRYANRGTELWYNFKRFIEEFQVCFLLDSHGQMDEILFDQLTNRYNREQQKMGKLILESKKEAKSNGHPSPDRADAVILAWAGRVYPLEEITGTKPASVTETPEEITTRLERELRDTLRQSSMDRLNQSKSKDGNKNPDGTYKKTGSFSFSHKSIYGEGSTGRAASLSSRFFSRRSH